MLIDMTNRAMRILNEIPDQEAVYQTLGNIEIVLGQTHLIGKITVDNGAKGLGLKVNHKNFVGESFVCDLCDQLNYLIECSPLLNIPVEIKFEKQS